MLPINPTEVQKTQTSLQPLENSYGVSNIALRVAGIALTTLAIGAVLTQLPGELLLAGIVLTGFAALTYLCITAIANSASTGNTFISTPNYGARSWSSFSQPIILLTRLITLPSYRPMFARGIEPMPTREFVGRNFHRPEPVIHHNIHHRAIREPVGIRRR